MVGTQPFINVFNQLFINKYMYNYYKKVLSHVFPLQLPYKNHEISKFVVISLLLIMYKNWQITL